MPAVVIESLKLTTFVVYRVDLYTPAVFIESPTNLSPPKWNRMMIHVVLIHHRSHGLVYIQYSTASRRWRVPRALR
jgi:outer membrane phospholipase A